MTPMDASATRNGVGNDLDNTREKTHVNVNTHANANANANANATHSNTQGDDSLTPLERAVLEEYAGLRDRLDQLTPLLADLATRPSASVLDALRHLERKTILVFTLLKSSVYSIVLQQEMLEGDANPSNPHPGHLDPTGATATSTAAAGADDSLLSR